MHVTESALWKSIPAPTSFEFKRQWCSSSESSAVYFGNTEQDNVRKYRKNGMWTI